MLTLIDPAQAASLWGNSNVSAVDSLLVGVVCSEEDPAKVQQPE